MNTIDLPGCTPEPLISYLKTLGLFRLVVEQADPSATMLWHGGSCRLRTKLDREGLIDFFVHHYRPTPIVGPWGARSGFYPGSSESSARAALNQIVDAAPANPRLAPFRDTIEAILKLLQANGMTEKVTDDSAKLGLMRLCRNELPDNALTPWFDAVFILTSDSRKFPPLLGTGGNEGSGSYVSMFAQLVVSLLIDAQDDGKVANALFGDFTSKLESISVGHFSPGALGGPNSSQGLEGGGGANPWDYLLAIEGTLLFAGGPARRLGSDTPGRVGAFPFCVEPVAVGYASESDNEQENGTRAELWLPIWSQEPTTLAELKYLFNEGRVQLGRHQARNAIEFSLALNLLGVNRGIGAFVRYAFVMRNGLSYFAVPLGRVPVTPKPEARLLDEPSLTSWLGRLRLATRDKEKTPVRYRAALRQVDRTIYEFSTKNQESSKVLNNVLRSLGRAEQTLALSHRFRDEHNIRPLQRLSPKWLEQADDKSVEFRLAASLAGLAGVREVGPFRAYLESVEPTKFPDQYEWHSDQNKSAVWSNRSVANNLSSIFLRRQMEAFRDNQSLIPMRSPRPASLSDVVEWIYEKTDDEKLGELIWGLSALAWSEVEFRARKFEPTSIPFEYGVPRLLVEPWDLTVDPRWGNWRLTKEESNGSKGAFDPAIFRVLASNQPNAIGRSVDQAARRLRAVGHVVQGHRNQRLASRSLAVASSLRADRLLAAMLFPLAPLDLQAVANAVLYPPETEE